MEIMEEGGREGGREGGKIFIILLSRGMEDREFSPIPIWNLKFLVRTSCGQSV